MRNRSLHLRNTCCTAHRKQTASSARLARHSLCPRGDKLSTPFPNRRFLRQRRGTLKNILCRWCALLLSRQPPVGLTGLLLRRRALLGQTPAPKIFQNDSILPSYAAIPEIQRINRRKPKRPAGQSSISATRECDAPPHDSFAAGHETSETSNETCKRPSSER